MTPLLDFGLFPDDSPALAGERQHAWEVYMNYLDDQYTITPLEATYGSPALLRFPGILQLPNEVYYYYLKDE
jgi:hypothetical protein